MAKRLQPEPGDWVNDEMHGMPKLHPPDEIPTSRITTAQIRQYVEYEGLGFCILALYSFRKNQRQKVAGVVECRQKRYATNRQSFRELRIRGEAVKHADMVHLMGKRVTVHAVLRRFDDKHWTPGNCPPWGGWIIGFTYKLDGDTSYDAVNTPAFTETSRQLCALITPWPTCRPRFVPLNGYTLGGQPQPPDHGGWRAFKQRQAAEPQPKTK